MDVKRGRFIVFDGPDGSGKATQTRIFVKRLDAEGYRTRKLEFPQYVKNIFADSVTAYLNGTFGNPVNINPYLASLFYTADRFKAAPQIIQDQKEGIISVTDRYTSASMGHQAAKILNLGKRTKYIEWLREIEFGEKGFGLPKPDLVVLLDVDPSTSHKLASARSHFIGREADKHETDYDYVQRVAQAFRSVAASEPTWRTVNCMNKNRKMLRPDVIAKKVWNIVQPYLPPIDRRRN